MDQRGLAFVVSRLFALYFLVETLASGSRVFANALSARRDVAAALLQGFSSYPLPAVYLLASVLLWFGAARLSCLVAADQTSGRGRFGGAALSRVVLVSAGVLVFASGADDLAKLLWLIWQRWAEQAAGIDRLMFLQPAISTLLKLLLGWALLVGAGMQALLAAAEKEGFITAPKRDLADGSLREIVGELASAAGSLGVRTVTDLAQRVVKSSVESMISALEQSKPDFSAVTASDGQVTIMFSDMEGFTAMTQRLGDEGAHKVIKIHNQVVRDCLAEFDGQEVELQGDGFLLAFADSAQALRCSKAIHRRLAKHSKRHPHEPIRVRIGLHSGQPIKEGERFFGITVIMAARIAAQAAGNETLVSQTVYQSVEELAEFTFEHALTAELKGLNGQHNMYPLLD